MQSVSSVMPMVATFSPNAAGTARGHLPFRLPEPIVFRGIVVDGLVAAAVHGQVRLRV